MEYRRLGTTDLRVSRLTLGTVALGADYGFQAGGTARCPAAAEAEAVMERAFARGINLVDTAPSYGEAEARLAPVLRRHPEVLVATKVNRLAGDAADAAARVAHQVEQSLRRLGRDRIDLLQIHNADVATLADGRFLRLLEDLVDSGKVRWLGASVYTAEAACAVMDWPAARAVQMPFNLLDQRPRRVVLARAVERKLGFLARSVFLKGVLSPRARFLPAHLAPLRRAAERVCRRFGIDLDQLPRLALRFALSAPGIDSVIVGPARPAELDAAVAAWEAGPLAPPQLQAAAGLALADDPLLDPSTWGVA